MNSLSHPDSSIPVLTEIISVEDAPVSDEILDDAHRHLKSDDAAGQPTISEHVFEQLEKTVRENILRQLMARIDFVLEHRVRDSLADVLQTAADGLAKEIRQGLNKSLEELIHRAVSQEISKIKSSNNQPQI